jgi:hypothetical protein
MTLDTEGWRLSWSATEGVASNVVSYVSAASIIVGVIIHNNPLHPG